MPKSSVRPTNGLLATMMHLRQGRPVSEAALAERLGCSTRQVARYLRSLRAQGVEVQHRRGPGGGYWITSNPLLPPVDLERDEVVALAALADAADQRIGLFGRKAGQAMRKLMAHLPSGLTEAMQGRSVDLSLSAGETEPGDLLAVLDEAAAQGRQLRVAYQPASGEPQVMELEPYRLLWAERAWYVVGNRRKLDEAGRPVGKEEMRNLRVGRFVSAQPTGRLFLVPEGWTLRSHLGNAWRLIRGKAQRIVLRFDRGFAPTAGATRWHPTQEAKTLKDGRLELRFRVDGLEEIQWWVLGYGPHVEVVAPESLRKRVAKLTRDAADRHGREVGKRAGRVVRTT